MKKTFPALTLLLSLFLITLPECKIEAGANSKTDTDLISAKPTMFSLFAEDTLPLFNKILVVIGENTKASSVIGNNKDAPYMNSIMQGGANFTQSYALLHPSQPNYLALFSGSDQGVGDNQKPSRHFTTPNLARELMNAGKKFICYSEDLPAVGYDGVSSDLYARKHNPVANWMGKGKNQVPPAANQPFTAFPTTLSLLPDVSFVIPNLCNNGHSSCLPYENTIKQFDVWIQKKLDAYKNWCLNNNSLLIITYDEDDNTEKNRIFTVFYGAHVNKGDYSEKINLYNILRTIEDAMGLTAHAGQAAKVKQITYCWLPVPRSAN